MPDGAPITQQGRVMRPAAWVQRDRIALRRRAVGIWGAGIVVIVLAGGSALAAGLPGWAVGGAVPALLALWLWWRDGTMRTQGGIPILTWHSVSRDPGWLPWAAAISVRPETLDRQLAILRQMGCQSMDTAEFTRRRLAGMPIAPDTVILHFDDGYLDNWVAAAPLLARHGLRASLFVSLDFIAPARARPASLFDPGAVLHWDGYLSWNELRALDQGAFGGAFRIEAHGVDHGRVVTGPRIVDRLGAQNWRRLAWVQWTGMPGDKHDWYRATEPPVHGYGSPVRQSAPALAAPARGPDGSPDGGEDQAGYRARLCRDLGACRAVFQAQLGRVPDIFCWPQNRTSPLARAVAADLGYLATTAGRGTNRADEDPAILSRVHVGERVAGFHWPAADDLFFRATIHGFRGNHYWYLPVLLLSALGRLVRAARRPWGRP